MYDGGYPMQGAYNYTPLSYVNVWNKIIKVIKLFI